MTTSGISRQSALLAVLALLTAAPAALAEIAISANDNKVVLVNGASTVVANAPSDTVTIIDLKAQPPKVIAEVKAPTSVAGPPTTVAITPDESLALVSAGMKNDPSDPTKQLQDTRVSVIDLKATPPAVIATIESGRAPAGIDINRAGNLALVANRGDGTVSVLTIAGKKVELVSKVKLGDEKSGPSGVSFTPDGRNALVTRDGDFFISVLNIDGTKVEHAKRDLSAGIRPYGLDISPRGDFAVVNNIGRGAGDSDTVSLIDLKAKPARVVHTLTVGSLPEGVKFSPDGSVLGIVLQSGTTKAKESPFYTDSGRLVMLRVDGSSLVKVSEAQIGGWSQGIVFNADGRTILVQNMVEKNAMVFHWDGTSLKDTGQRIGLSGGGAALRTAY